jgi:hypothetical protein
MLVHFADERPHLRVGKVANAVAEDPLVLGENGQRLCEFGGILGHGSYLLAACAGGPASLRKGWIKTQCYHREGRRPDPEPAEGHPEPAEGRGRL